MFLSFSLMKVLGELISAAKATDGGIKPFSQGVGSAGERAVGRQDCQARAGCCNAI